MPRFSVDYLNDLIADNRKHIAKLQSDALSGNPLLQRVASHLELAVNILERHRNEMLGSESKNEKAKAAHYYPSS